MRIQVFALPDGLFSVEWKGADDYFRCRRHFHNYRDAERFAAQLECLMLIERLLTAYDPTPLEEARLN